MVLQKLWVSQNFSRISQVSQSRFLSGYVRLAVSFSIRRCLATSFPGSLFSASIVVEKRQWRQRRETLGTRLGVSESQNTLKSRSRNLKSQNVSGSQGKTLVSPSRIYHSPPLSFFVQQTIDSFYCKQILNTYFPSVVPKYFM